MLIWPQNAQNLISEDLNLKNFTGEDFPGAGISAVRISNTLLWSPVSGQVGMRVQLNTTFRMCMYIYWNSNAHPCQRNVRNSTTSQCSCWWYYCSRKCQLQSQKQPHRVIGTVESHLNLKHRSDGGWIECVKQTSVSSANAILPLTGPNHFENYHDLGFYSKKVKLPSLHRSTCSLIQ